MDLSYVKARLAYLGQTNGRISYTVYPPSSGREPVSPPKKYCDVPIYDCRPMAKQLRLDREGFVLLTQDCDIGDFLDEQVVTTHYYPQTEALLKEVTGALAVVAFDHNVRSAIGAPKGQAGVRAPVDAVHDDYTEKSGEKRVRELLEDRGQTALLHHRAALITFGAQFADRCKTYH